MVFDNLFIVLQVLLSRVNLFSSKDLSSSANSSLQMYRKTAEAVMCGLIPKSPTATSSGTDGGLIWVSEWNALQHPVAAAFLAVIYSDYMLSSRTARISCDGHSYKPSDLRKVPLSQADYVLGNNPMKMSFLVGYGDNYPQYVHHISDVFSCRSAAADQLLNISETDQFSCRSAAADQQLNRLETDQFSYRSAEADQQLN
ncbi:endoglucanase 24-like [Spinacia oleracea]|uniref:cellulase n=1 Tax=Spinacia oleracea TaxID=3562 RepID=A0A9R0J8U8_SPIOL|nr:endoglucanase 24-like [Spinacia oleracea]